MAFSRNAWLVAGAAAAGFAAGTAFASQRPWIVGAELPRSIPTETDPIADIPGEADVVVIGGGIAGVSTALFLNEFGLRTVVFEKGQVGGEASSRNFGWMYSNGLHPDKLELAVESKKIWLAFRERFGFDVSVRQNGNTLLLADEAEAEEYSEWAARARERFPKDIDARVVRGDALYAMLPEARGRFVAALHQASDGTAEPTEAVPLIAKGARGEGVKVFAPVAVRGIETAGGAVHSVVTELGEVRTQRVVLAGGAWSRLFLGNLGVDLPQQLIASSMMRVSGGRAGSGAGYGHGVTWREQIDGSYSIGVNRHAVPVTLDSFRMVREFIPSLLQTLRHPGDRQLALRIGSDLVRSLGAQRHWSNSQVTPFERVRFLSARPMRKVGDEALAQTRGFFPGLADAAIVERWAGVLDATPDSTSVISEVPSIPGLVVNTGHSAQGFTFGPGAGKLAAEIVADLPRSIDPFHFRFERFTDGTPIALRELI